MIKIQFPLCIKCTLSFSLETLQFSPSSQKRNILRSIWKWTNSSSNGSISQHFYNIRKLHFLLHFAIMVSLQGLSIQITKVTFIFLSLQYQVSPLVHLIQIQSLSSHIIEQFYTIVSQMINAYITISENMGDTKLHLGHNRIKYSSRHFLNPKEPYW